MKNQIIYLKIIFTVLALLVFQIEVLQAQIVGTDAYIKGTGIELGFNGNGGFEGADATSNPAPAGMHFRSNTQYFGFVANPQNNAWATFDGDFFTPGSQENGWGITIGANSFSGSNNCSDGGIGTTVEIPGSITNYSHNFNCYNVDWEGNLTTGGTNLHFKIDYLLEETALYYTTTVYIKNNTSLTIPELYYYRNLDPDNNVMINGGDYYTQNTIVSQPGIGGCNIAHVSATQSAPWNSYVGLAAAGDDWRATYGEFANRSGYDLWTGWGGWGTDFVQTVGSTINADEAISLSYRIQNLAPGATKTLKFVVILGASSATNAINNLMYFTYPGSTSITPSACTPYVDTVYTCGGTVPISITGSAVDDYSWTWSPATGLSQYTGPSVIANPSVTTSYSVSGVPLTSCLTPVTYSIVVKVTSGSGINVIITPVPPQCISNPNFNLTVNVAGGTWSGDGITEASLGTFSPATAGVGNHTIIYSIPGSVSCPQTDTIIVTIYSQPTISAIGDTICNGSQASISATGGSTYQWDNSAGSGGTVTVTPNITTTYTVTGTDISGCSNTASCVVIVNPNITTLNISASTNPICAGISTTLTANGATNYSWSGGLGAANPLTVTPASTTTYTVTGTTASCTGTASITVTVNPNLLPTVTAVNSTCGFSNGSATVTQAGLNYLWSNTQTTQTINNLSSGTYTVNVTDANGCSGTGNCVILNIPGPTAEFSENPKVLTLLDDPVSFVNNSSGNIVNYLWDFGDGVSCNNISPQHKYNNIGNYLVTLIVTDNNGCMDTVSDTIKVKEYFTFYIPNAFTPDGDDINSLFYPSGINVDPDNFNMMIFDRWGALIFNTRKWYDNHSEGWNGTINNSGNFNDAMIGVYVYRIVLKEIDGRIHEYIGRITLIP